MNLANFIKQTRMKRDYSIRGLSRSSGVSHPYISQIETGKIEKPSPDILKKIASPLGVPLYELMALAGYMDDKTLIDTIISEVGKTTIELDGAKELIADYEGRAKRAAKNNVTKKGYTAAGYLAERDNLLEYVEVTQKRQDELIKKVNTLPKSEDLLFEILEETSEIDSHADQVNKNIKDVYFDFFQLDRNEHKLFYKGELITEKQVNDIVKFIESFIINKEDS